MGDVLLFAALGGWVGGVITAQRCFNRLMLRPDICRYYKKRINHTAFWTVFKSGRYSNTLSTGICFNDNHVIIEVTFLLLLITLEIIYHVDKTNARRY